MSKLRQRILARYRRLYADIDTPAILDMGHYFPAHAALAAQTGALRDEALRVLGDNPNIPRFHDITTTQTRISAEDGKNWRLFVVKSYGHVIRANAAQMPVLAGFLAGHREVTSAMISYLDPGKHIPRHRGPFRGILRYHLCLLAPAGGTDTGPWLEVDGQRVPYREGQGLLWDDTFPHEVLNPGDHARIAILLDIRRPVTRPRQRALFRVVMAGGRLASMALEGRMRVTPRPRPPKSLNRE